MAMDGCGNLMKYSFGFVNLLIFIGGAVLIGVGAASLAGGGSGVGDLISNEVYQGTAVVIIVGGSLVLIVSFLGCCGAFKESKCLLGTFFCLVLVMFVLVVAGAVAAFVVGSDKVLNTIEKDMKKSMTEYGNNDAITKSWDAIQKGFECCGVDGKQDWRQDGKQDIPKSCHADNKKTGKIFEDGCLDFFKHNSKVLGGIAIGSAIFLFISMIFSCAIMKSIR